MKHLKVIYAVSIAVMMFLVNNVPAEAGWFHATSKAAARSIMKKGINPFKSKSTARFGKGFYAAKTPSTALAEKGGNKAILQLKGSGYLKRNTLDFRKPSATSLHKQLGSGYDLRGAVKNKTIGPKAAHQLGKTAGNQGKAIQYRSVQNGGANLFVPKKVIAERPRILRPEKIVSVGKTN
jgi:hypothetical protein